MEEKVALQLIIVFFKYRTVADFLYPRYHCLRESQDVNKLIIRYIQYGYTLPLPPQVNAQYINS